MARRIPRPGDIVGYYMNSRGRRFYVSGRVLPHPRNDERALLVRRLAGSYTPRFIAVDQLTIRGRAEPKIDAAARAAARETANIRLAEIKAKVAELEREQQELTEAICQCEAGAEPCPLIPTRDAADD